jgi:hypothetical protein
MKISARISLADNILRQFENPSLSAEQLCQTSDNPDALIFLQHRNRLLQKLGAILSSASTGRIYRPLALAIPAFLADGNP